MTEYLNLGFNIAVIVFIGLGMIFGLIRGLRKTASRGIFLILITILTLFITIPITNALLGIKFNTTMTLGDTTLTGSLSLEEILSILLEEFIGKDFVTNNPEFAGILISIPIIMINSIVYVLLFLILKDLLMPLNYLFYRLTFAPRKKKENLGFSANNNDENSQPLGNIFEMATPQDIAEQTAPQQQPDFHPVDNSLFTPPTNQSNEDSQGMFIKKDPENVDIHGNAPTFDFSEEKADKKTKEKKKKEKKQKEEKPEKIKAKKHRLLGGLVGCFVGLLIMSNTLLPIYSAIDILKTANSIKLEHIGNEPIDLSSITNGLTDEIINSYESSALKFASKYTGMEVLAIAQFDYLTTQKISDKKIVLRQDINAIVNTIESIDNLVGKYKSFSGENNYTNLDKSQLSILIEDTQKVIAKSKEIKMVDCLSEYLIPMTCSILLKEDMKLSNNTDMNTMIKSTLRSISNENKINTFDELTAILDLAKYLNDRDILSKLLHNDLSDPIKIINSLDSQLVEKLFALKTIDASIPHVLNIGFTLLNNSINFGYVKNEAENAQIKEAFSSFVSNVLEFSKTVDTNSNILITNNSLIPLGKVLETIKSSGIVNEDSYDNLVEFLSDKLEDIISDILPEEFDSFIKDEFLNNISKVDNWEYEMTCINNGIIKLRNVEYGILGEVKENEILRQGLTVEIIMKEGVLKNLGEALDILEESCLFGAVTSEIINDERHTISGTTSLMTNILDYAKTLITEKFDNNDDYKNLTKVLDEMKVNLITSHHTYSKNTPFWKDEFSAIEPLIVNMYNILDAESFELNENLGLNLDKAKESVIFGYKHGSTNIRNNTTLTLMSVAMDMVKSNILPENYIYNDGTDIDNKQTINDKIYELFDTINKNLKTEACKIEVLRKNFWKKEINYFISLNNLADKATDINEISQAIALSGDLDKIYKSYIIPRNEINNLIAHTIRQTKYNSTDKIKLSINNTIENIATRLETPEYFDDKDMENFWTIELGHIEQLTNIKYSDEEGYSAKDNLNSIGQTLDKIHLGHNDVRGAYLIIHSDIGEILSSAIEEMKDDLIPVDDSNTTLTNAFNNAITSIANNFKNANITKNISFQFELNKIESLSNIDVQSDLFKYPSDSLKLLALGKKIDNISFNRELSEYKYLEDNNSAIVTRNILNTLIIDMLDTAKATIEDNIDLSFNALITDIQKEISNHNTNDSYISWEREFSYFNNLISLNKNTTYTIDNIATEIGSNIDLIAFKRTGNKFNDISNNDYTYFSTSTGNSLFITRQALIKAIYGSKIPTDENPGFLSTVKYDTTLITDNLEKEEKDIINSIIDNSGQIALTNTDLMNNKTYKCVTLAFSELNEIDQLISTKIDLVTGQNIQTLNGNSETGSEIDTMLNTLEGKIACGVSTTRRIAILILNHIEIPTLLQNTSGGLYHNELLTNFTNNQTNDVQTSENYETKKPFETLFNKSIA